MLIECMTEGVFEITGLNVRDGSVFRDTWHSSAYNFAPPVVVFDSVLLRYYVATVDNLQDEPSVARAADVEDGAAAEDVADNESSAAVELLWSYVRSYQSPFYLS